MYRTLLNSWRTIDCSIQDKCGLAHVLEEQYGISRFPPVFYQRYTRALKRRDPQDLFKEFDNPIQGGEATLKTAPMGALVGLLFIPL